MPYILVLGDQELNHQSVTIRKRGQKQLLEMPLEEFVLMLQKEILEKQ